MPAPALSWPTPRLSPAGALSLSGAAEGDGPVALQAAFERSTGEGLLQLATAELSTPLPEPLAFLRELSKRLLAQLCTRPDVDASNQLSGVEPGPGDLRELIDRAPPFPGAEYLSLGILLALWRSTEGAAARACAAYPSIGAFLDARAPLFRRVGHLSFHLADNPRDEAFPFAFLATFAHQVSDHGAVQNLPLLRALELYGASGNKPRLLRLLEPLERAARASSFIGGLVADHSIYQPLSLSAREAFALLRDAPAIEAAGIRVRIPDWWRARSKPAVTAKIGKAPTSIGVDGLLDFSVSVALGDQTLSEAELRALLASDEPLVRLRGQWVEVDKEQLKEALSYWKEAEKLAREGVSFSEAMRLFLGFQRGGLGEQPEQVRAWSRVEAGPWLAELLASMRSPGQQQAGEQALAGLRATLRPYQSAGVRWLTLLGGLGLGACLADDMGLGKTVQVIGALLARKAAHPGEVALVVAPASLLANWASEIARFAPSLRVRVAHGGKQSDDLRDTDVVLTSYGMLARIPWLASTRWGSVVLDEAQAIKNASSRQSKLARSLEGSARIAVTGTPVENRLGDLWSIFDFLNPGLLGSARAFSQFLKESQQREGAQGRLRALVRPYLLRRLKSDRTVAADLPEKTEIDAFCLLTRRQATLYQAEVEGLRKALVSRDAMARKGAVLASMLRLKQICDHPSLFTGDGAFDPEDSGKFERLAALADEIAQRQERALVFTQFRELTGPLLAFLSRVFGAPGLCLHGGTPVRERKRLVDTFQRDDGPPFFVISLKAGGVGLNLTAASHVIHVDRWWNPAVENQATDRAHRIGQTRHVMVHKMMCKGTLDERIDAMIRGKQGLADGILDQTSEAVLTELSDEELLDVVRLDLDSFSGDL